MTMPTYEISFLYRYYIIIIILSLLNLATYKNSFKFSSSYVMCQYQDRVLSRQPTGG